MKLNFILFFSIILLSRSLPAQKGFINPLKIGNYYEYVYEESAFSYRYKAKITKDTIINGKVFFTMNIYDEPAMGNYTINYMLDTVSLNLYSPGGFCSDITGFNLLGGFKLQEGFIWDTCRKGTPFKSSILDTGISSGILNSGIPLRYFARKDTIGGAVGGNIYEYYTELFGFASFYSDHGSPFGNGPYGKSLMGAIINGVKYGEILSDINQIPNEIPAGYILQQNFPNPFNPSTVIQFVIPKKQNVKLTVFNSLGQEINILADGIKSAGKYQYIFNGKNLTSGIYFYRLETDNFTETKRMVLVK